MLRARRAGAQLLHRPAGGEPAGVVRHLLAVQAQRRRTPALALRARAPGLTADALERARAQERTLVAAWLVRGTLHVVHRDDHAWLLALTAPRQAAMSRRRLGQEGVSEDDARRALGIISAALADDGPLTRRELGERVAVRGIRTEGQAMAHLVLRAALEGLVVLGPERHGAPAFVHARDWLGVPRRPVPREAALAELARRYLAAHGPAGEGDLAWWSGLPRRDARAGLRAIAGELADEPGGLVDLAGRGPAPPGGVRLLPAYDEYLLGWRERGFALAAEHARRVHPGGGVLRASVAVDGELAGTWRLERGRVTVEPFPGRELDVPAEEIAEVEAFRS